MAKYGGVELSGETTSYVELGDNILGALEDFTISVWVNSINRGQCPFADGQTEGKGR